MKLSRVLVATIAAVALVAGPIAVAAPAEARGTVLCRTYAECEAAGMTHHDYPSYSKTEYWRMTKGHNCTNYVAYMLIKAGMSNTRPWVGNGNANGWGQLNPDLLDQTPTTGSVAWWDANDGVGSLGHVAYVERVNANSIVISEDNWLGEFFWRVIYKTDPAWPTGFLHFKDSATSSSFPAYRARALQQTVWTDSTKNQLVSTENLKPGTTFWVTMTYQNTGDQSWVGSSLKTSSATSPLASNWLAPNIPTTQKQSLVITGATATYSFPVSIPAGVPDGTVFTETFTPVDTTGAPISLGGVTMDFTADSRETFTFKPELAVSGAPKQGNPIYAVSSAPWEPVAPTYTFQWLRDGKPIAGAINNGYVPTGADVGRTLSVATVAEAPGYIPVKQSAAATGVTRSIYGNTLVKKAKLSAKAQLVSANGVYRLVHGKKGNLAVVNRFTKKTVWSSKKYSKGAYSRLRSDGVLVTYSKSGKVVWSTKKMTAGKKVVRAAITNSGKLALYSSTGKVVWKS